MEVLASGRTFGVNVEKKRYWCDNMGINKDNRMKAEEIYPIIHSPVWMPHFQQALGVTTTRQDMAKMALVLPGTALGLTAPGQQGYVAPNTSGEAPPPPSAPPIE